MHVLSGGALRLKQTRLPPDDRTIAAIIRRLGGNIWPDRSHANGSPLRRRPKRCDDFCPIPMQHQNNYGQWRNQGKGEKYRCRQLEHTILHYLDLATARLYVHFVFPSLCSFNVLVKAGLAFPARTAYLARIPHGKRTYRCWGRCPDSCFPEV